MIDRYKAELKEDIIQGFKKILASSDVVDKDNITSPIEGEFIETLKKHLLPEVKIDVKHPIQTIVGKPYVDFLLTFGDKRIAIECNGDQYNHWWKINQDYN